MIVLKRLLVLAVFMAISLHAAPAEMFKKLGYSDTYEQALKKAKDTDKPMMLVISEKTCPWCRKLENQVLKKDNINTFVQKSFVGLGLEKNDDVYPKNFIPKVVPTVVFVDSKDESIIFKSYGYLAKKEFLEVLVEVDKKYKGFANEIDN